jgi:hypothetical protein
VEEHREGREIDRTEAQGGEVTGPPPVYVHVGSCQTVILLEDLLVVRCRRWHGNNELLAALEYVDGGLSQGDPQAWYGVHCDVGEHG